MTDSEKLDMLLAQMQEMKKDINGIKSEVSGIRSEVNGIRSEVSGIKSEVKDIKQRVARLEVGQTEVKGNLFRIDRKITDTYNLALDAWGQGAENRKWLEDITLKA